jgi:hypothetical protein
MAKAKSYSVPSMPKTVTISKADNGFTVSCYTDKGQKSMIAKSENEAVRHAKTLLGAKKGK